ncbi:hypothetical protein GILI108418_11925 [Gillisia limnaea]
MIFSRLYLVFFLYSCSEAIFTLLPGKTEKETLIMANTKWVIDPTHSEVTFKVKHLMISTATGNFKVFQGSVETETEEFTKVKNLKFKADVKSVNTNNEDRDTHLKSEDFFNVEKFSEIEFTSEKFDVAAGTIEGKLTIKDTTNLLVLMLILEA